MMVWIAVPHSTDHPAEGKRSRLPSGTVTFLFTDIEGSTRLVRRQPDAYPVLLERHRQLVRDACNSGVEFGSEGDALFFAFPRADHAVAAAADAQRRLDREPWPVDAAIRVRMGISTGVGQLLGDNYVGVEPHRTARVCAAAHGGQVLTSGETAALCEHLPSGVALRPLGRHVLKDFDEPTELAQVVIAGCPEVFPPPRTAQARIVALPRETTPLVGRDPDLTRVQELVVCEPLVTLTGAGGSGKTRLAIASAWNAAPLFRGHVAFVPLAHLHDARDVAGSVAGALGWAAMLESWDDILGVLRDQNALLVLDNLEHLLPAAAGLVDRLLEQCPRVHVLVTSRVATQVVGEQLYPVAPLQTSDAVDLIITRARRDRPGFDPDAADVRSLRKIAVKLDGLPLALELAAARLRVLPPNALLERLERQSPILEASDPSLPDRLRTMRGAIQWSYDLLTRPDQALLCALSVFPRATSLEAVAAIAGMDEIEALDGLTRLIDASVVHVDDLDGPRYGMLEPIRQFAHDQLEARDEAHELHMRMFDWFCEKTGPLRPYVGDLLVFLYHERDNALRALNHGGEAGEWHRGVDLCFKLTTIMFQVGASAATAKWARLAEQSSAGLALVDRAKLLLVHAAIEPELDEQIAALQAAVELAREAGCQQLLNLSLLGLTWREFGAGRLDLADAALAGITDPDPSMLVLVAGARALAVGMRGPTEHSVWAEAEALALRSDIPCTGAEVLNNMAWTAVLNGDGDDARRLSKEALRLDDEQCAAHSWYLPKSLFDTQHTAALAAVLTGDVEAAARHFTAVLATSSELGASERVFSVARLLHGVCGLLALAGRAEDCVRLLGYVEPRVDPHYARIDAHGSYKQLLAESRDATGDRTQELLAFGNSMSDGEAVEFAINHVQAILADGAGVSPPSPTTRSAPRIV